MRAAGGGKAFSCSLQQCLHPTTDFVCVRHLEHGPDVLQMRGTGEGRLDVADRLHQSLSRLGHLLHLYIVEKAPLLLASYTCTAIHRTVKWPKKPTNLSSLTACQSGTHFAC